MRAEPISSRDIHDLEPLIQMYLTSGIRIKVKRILGWWTMTPCI